MEKNGQVFGQTIKNHFATNHFMEPVYHRSGNFRRRKFSPVSKVVQIKHAKFFLLIGHVAKIKCANISYVKKKLCENFSIMVFMNCQ